jgi:hypothetical protein
MEIVQVEITGMVMTNRYGTLSSGDVLRTDPVFAKHLVEECGAAKYITAKAKKLKASESPVTRTRKAKLQADDKADDKADAPDADDKPATLPDAQDLFGVTVDNAQPDVKPETPAAQ